MRKTSENSHDNEVKKLTEKSFIFNITACIVGVVLCLASLSAVTWAWFSSSVSSASNDVQSGNYSVNVEITEVDNPSVTLVADDKGVYTLENDKKYSVTITGDGTVSTGFCMLEIKSGTNAGTNAVTKWFTEQIYTDHAENNANEKKAITFEIEIIGGGTLKITSYWGKYNSATVFDGASYLYSDDAHTSLGGTVNEPEETTKAEETTAAEETTKAEETTAAEKTTTAEETTASVVTE